MDAKDKTLNFVDVLKVWARKFLRLAPAYYTLWLFLYVGTPRLVLGMNGWVADMQLHDCKTDWPYVATMTGNLIGNSMDAPFEGCYQISWPLQMDM
jgi:hypothetical protein